MSLGLTVIGLSVPFGNLPPVPYATDYDTIEVYGDGIFDKLWGRNETIPKSTIESYTFSNYTPTWTNTTYVLGDFENDLSTGNIRGITATPESWLIYRLDEGRSSLRFIAELDISSTEYKDYLPVINETYTYYLYIKTANELSNPLLTEPIIPNYYGHFLIDADNEVSYKFDLNVTSGDFSTDNDWSEYATNLKYNKYSLGARNFVSGSLTAIVRDENVCIGEDMNQTISILKSLRDFVTTSTGTKYLKTRRGEIFKVFTHDYSQSQWVDEVREQIYMSSFNFKEIGDVYDN